MKVEYDSLLKIVFADVVGRWLGTDWARVLEFMYVSCCWYCKAGGQGIFKSFCSPSHLTSTPSIGMFILVWNDPNDVKTFERAKYESDIIFQIKIRDTQHFCKFDFETMCQTSSTLSAQELGLRKRKYCPTSTKMRHNFKSYCASVFITTSRTSTRTSEKIAFVPSPNIITV